jgi:hypothetical protein
MALANTTAMSAEMTVSFCTYQNGSAELVNLLGALQQVVAEDYTIKIGVCQYGSGQVFLTLVPTVPHSVVELIVEHFTCSDDGGLDLIAKQSQMSILCVMSILETAKRMKQG